MPLIAQTQFSLAGTLFIVALMFAPLLISYLVSVYENRLSVYFSEQVGEPINLKKVHLIFSVIISSTMPVFALSFGLLVAAQVTDRLWPPAAAGEVPTNATERSIVFYAFSLVLNELGVWLLKHLLFKKHLAAGDQLEARAYFMRWQRYVNMLAAFLNVTLFWLANWLFKDLASISLN